MSKAMIRFTALSAAFGVYASAITLYGASQSDYDGFSDVVDQNGVFLNEDVDASLVGTEWDYADRLMGRINLQNPTDCGLKAFFVPHATLTGEGDLRAPKQYSRTLDRNILCKNLFTGEVFQQEFEIQNPR